MKRYIVEATAHGSGIYRSDEPALELSLAKAKQAAILWCSYADTVGGHARVVTAKTRKVVWNP